MSDGYPLILHNRAELMQLLKVAEEFGVVKLTEKGKRQIKNG
jgi:hypothetical protein